jgi:DNA polymerase (family 10)
MTARIIAAIEHPATTILGHPTGRLLLEREGYALAIEEVLAAAAENRVAVEINANPHRLDLDWRCVKAARDRGVKLAINTDAHSPEGLGFMRFGVGIARKGWLEKKDVINTFTLKQFRKFAAKKQ